MSDTRTSSPRRSTHTVASLHTKCSLHILKILNCFLNDDCAALCDVELVSMGFIGWYPLGCIFIGCNEYDGHIARQQACIMLKKASRRRCVIMRLLCVLVMPYKTAVAGLPLELPDSETQSLRPVIYLSHSSLLLGETWYSLAQLSTTSVYRPLQTKHKHLISKG